MAVSPSFTEPSLADAYPQMTFSSVVLPEPFDPIRPVTSPGSAVSDTSWSAATPPNDLETPSTLTRLPCTCGSAARSGELPFPPAFPFPPVATSSTYGSPSMCAPASVLSATVRSGSSHLSARDAATRPSRAAPPRSTVAATMRNPP